MTSRSIKLLKNRTFVTLIAIAVMCLCLTAIAARNVFSCSYYQRYGYYTDATYSTQTGTYIVYCNGTTRTLGTATDYMQPEELVLCDCE